jgi:hypothetical protein
LFTTDPVIPALVYDERNTHVVQQPLDRHATALMGHDYKAFFEAEWDGNHWKLGKRVGYQDW